MGAILSLARRTKCLFTVSWAVSKNSGSCAIAGGKHITGHASGVIGGPVVVRAQYGVTMAIHHSAPFSTLAVSYLPDLQCDS